ncbi:MAG: hypothetical protein WBW35_05135 [Xanthobacteraceae bacterium]
MSDFKEVLRKKHANGAAWLGDRNTLGLEQFIMQYQWLKNGVRRRCAARRKQRHVITTILRRADRRKP